MEYHWSQLRKLTVSNAIVSIEEAKAHLNVTHDEDDAKIGNLIRVAQGELEGPTGAGIALDEATWELVADSGPVEIKLCPVVEVISVSQGGEDIPFEAELRIEPVQVRGPKPSTTSPVIVQFRAGHSDVPADLKHAALLIVQRLYDQDESVDRAIASIVGRYRPC
jgi:uncharacterized phiE125 gp8 family phage protein